MVESHSVSKQKRNSIFNSLTIAALGVVFGDIGTSPLYAVREAFYGKNAFPLTTENIQGVLSLILWSLILVVSVKYLGFIMRADNKKEGGVLALTSLAFPARFVRMRPQLRYYIFFGLFGSALLIGDGIITPAISVLGAIEGLEMATPVLSHYVLPLSIVILTLLFFQQKHGSGRIGSVFGPILLVWFSCIGILGIRGILMNPKILIALNPLLAIQFFILNGIQGLVVLGAVFLVTTGGEALYADMGHFGRKPIEKAWFFIAFPGLILNYFGQGALLLTDPQTRVNPFYSLAPNWALYPLIILATMAAVIASQAMISGVFSLTRQAIHLGYAPRFRIIHTSNQEIGQIYIPQINWILFVLTIWLVLEFRSSDALASAYGIAVSTTMVITTLLASIVAKNRWKWNTLKIVCTFLFFLLIDLLFFGSNLTKIADGGWVPLLVATCIFTLMITWHQGRHYLIRRIQELTISFPDFFTLIEKQKPQRVKGTALFLTGNPKGTPSALIHNMKHNRILHEKNLILTFITEDSPYVPFDERIVLEELGPNFYKIIAKFGFMETPDIHEIIRSCNTHGLNIALEDIIFFLGRETLISTGKSGMAIWREKLFSLMSKNAERATAFFNIPPEQVVEIGFQVEL